MFQEEYYVLCVCVHLCACRFDENYIILQKSVPLCQVYFLKGTYVS